MALKKGRVRRSENGSTGGPASASAITTSEPSPAPAALHPAGASLCALPLPHTGAAAATRGLLVLPLPPASSSSRLSRLHAPTAPNRCSSLGLPLQLGSSSASSSSRLSRLRRRLRLWPPLSGRGPPQPSGACGVPPSLPGHSGPAASPPPPLPAPSLAWEAGRLSSRALSPPPRASKRSRLRAVRCKAGKG